MATRRVCTVLTARPPRPTTVVRQLRIPHCMFHTRSPIFSSRPSYRRIRRSTVVISMDVKTFPSTSCPPRASGKYFVLSTQSCQKRTVQISFKRNRWFFNCVLNWVVAISTLVGILFQVISAIPELPTDQEVLTLYPEILLPPSEDLMRLLCCRP